jgi:phospholipase/lecithinase/hemolysin
VVEAESDLVKHYHHKSITKLFVFGDSYADTGNIKRGFASSWKNPYGITFPGKPAGRFSDGRVLTDYIGMCVSVQMLVSLHVLAFYFLID